MSVAACTEKRRCIRGRRSRQSIRLTHSGKLWHARFPEFQDPVIVTRMPVKHQHGRRTDRCKGHGSEEGPASSRPVKNKQVLMTVQTDPGWTSQGEPGWKGGPVLNPFETRPDICPNPLFQGLQPVGGADQDA